MLKYRCNWEFRFIFTFRLVCFLEGDTSFLLNSSSFLCCCNRSCVILPVIFVSACTMFQPKCFMLRLNFYVIWSTRHDSFIFLSFFFHFGMVVWNTNLSDSWLPLRCLGFTLKRLSIWQLVTGVTVCCCNDNLQCHQWQQSCQIDNLFFSVWLGTCKTPGISFYWHGLTLIPTWISNHMPCKVWDEIDHPVPNFNSCTVEVR